MTVGQKEVWTASLLVIGDEILSGRTQDANLACLANWLNGQGIRLKEARVVPDEVDAIIIALNALRAQYDYVFTTGGIGPTHDDITAQCIADAFSVALTPQPEAVDMLKSYYKDALTDQRLRMALMPQGAELIINKSSGAPGFRIGNVYVLAGIPSVMRSMLDGLHGVLKGGAPLLSKTISAYVRESEIAPLLAAVQKAHAGIALGSYPKIKNGRPAANFVFRGTDADVIDAAMSDLMVRMQQNGFEPLNEEI